MRVVPRLKDLGPNYPRTGAELSFLYHSCLVRSQATHPVLRGPHEGPGMFTDWPPHWSSAVLELGQAVLLLEKPQVPCKRLMPADSYLQELRSADTPLEQCARCSGISRLPGPPVQWVAVLPVSTWTPFSPPYPLRVTSTVSAPDVF